MKKNKITREKYRRWIGAIGGNFRRFTLRHSKELGCYVIYDKIENEYSYRMSPEGWPRWIRPRSFKRREKLGLPEPRRKKRIMQDAMFSLDEIELASSIMEKLT